MNLIVAIVLFMFGLPFVRSIPIANSVVGSPEVQCGSKSLIVSFLTEAVFEGKVYVRDFYNDKKCIRRPEKANRKASIELPFEDCGVRRERSVNPRGVYVSTAIVISFHETFVTKIDKAVRIQCFYMEAEKTVSQELEVSMLTTELQTLQVPMPTCRYDILDGGPNGEPIRFTTIGQQIYHKWTCDSDTTDTFCMVVYDCMVDDGSGDKIQLLDQEGCALDKYLLGNLEYPMDLMGGREAHVFKYADRAHLYFNCQIRITVKEPGSECDRPQCPSLRRKRSVEAPAAIVDVSTLDPLMVADVDLNMEDVPRKEYRPTMKNNYCFLRIGLGTVLSMCIAVIFVTLAVTLSIFFSKRFKF